MDFVTFFFALVPPLLAAALAVFAQASSAYVERQAALSAREFGNAGIGPEAQAGIRDAIVLVAKGALLLANMIATISSCAISVAVPIYFLPGNYFIISAVTAVIILYTGWVITKIAAYGLKDIYIQKVRTRRTEETGETRTYTYGSLIDWGMIALNLLLAAITIYVFLATGPSTATAVNPR